MIAAGGLALAPMATPVAAAVDAMPGEGDGAFAALLAADVATTGDAAVTRDVALPTDAARDGLVATAAVMPLPSTIAPMPTPTLSTATIADAMRAGEDVTTAANAGAAASPVVRFDASASRAGTSTRTDASRGKPAFAATASFAAWARAGLGEAAPSTAPAIGAANAATTAAAAVNGAAPGTAVANATSPSATPTTNTVAATPAPFGLDALQAMRGTPGQLTLAETLAQDAGASLAIDGNASTITTTDARGADAAALLVDTRAPVSGGPREATTLITGTATQPVEVRVNAAGVTTQHVPLSGSAALLHVEAQVHDAKFAQACADRVVWCINEKVQQAEIRLEPPELGPIGVTIDIDGSDVHARFTAAHAQVREALEQALPKLREMVAQDGLQLASADIGGGQRDARQSGDAPQSSRASGDDSGAASRGEAGTAIEQRIARHRGLLDEYA